MLVLTTVPRWSLHGISHGVRQEMLDPHTTKNCVDLNYCMDRYRSFLNMGVAAEGLALLIAILMLVEDGKPIGNPSRAVT